MPAEALDAFNQAIVGPIEVIASLLRSERAVPGRQQCGALVRLEVAMNEQACDSLQQILVEHGLIVHRQGTMLRIEGTSLTLEAQVFERTHPSWSQLQLDIRATDPLQLGDRVLIESFAGVGNNIAAALHQGFEKFCRASLHVILASLVAPTLGEDQVEWEHWSDGQPNWQVCLGPLLFQMAEPDLQASVVQQFGPFLNALRTHLLAEAAPGTHWIRVYRMAQADTTVGLEALLDNMPWPSAADLLHTWPWPVRESHYALRHFLIARGQPD